MNRRLGDTPLCPCSFGKTLIVKDVTDIEPFLYPILKRMVFKQGSRIVVAFGEGTVDYSEGFKLYLVSKKPATHFSADGARLVNIVNFTGE